MPCTHNCLVAIKSVEHEQHKSRKEVFLTHVFKVVPSGLLVFIDFEPITRRKAVYLLEGTKQNEEKKDQEQYIPFRDQEVPLSLTHTFLGILQIISTGN